MKQRELIDLKMLKLRTHFMKRKMIASRVITYRESLNLVADNSLRDFEQLACSPEQVEESKVSRLATLLINVRCTCLGRNY